MSTTTRYTPAQLRGVTDTSDAGGPEPSLEPDTGAWSEDLDRSIYGEREWLLPGLGDEGAGCGEWAPREFCDAAGHVQLGQHLCGRRSCPRCWNGQWARPRTVSVVQRLAAARYAEPDGIRRRAVHVIVSPAEGSVVSIEDFYRARRKAIDRAKEHGVRGGLIVPHGYRVTDDAKAEFRALLDAGEWDLEADGGIWRWVRENRRDWRDQTYWSPHFHVLGLAVDVDAGDGAGGWVVKNVKRGDRHSLKPFRLTDESGYEDMAAAARYLLSHATYEADGSRQVVTWFGALHATNFDPEEALSAGAWEAIKRTAEEVVGGRADRGDGADSEEPETCPVDGCEGVLHPIWEAGEFLTVRGEDLPRSNEHTLARAHEWACGDREPPPGLKHPRTEQQAREALDALL